MERILFWSSAIPSQSSECVPAACSGLQTSERKDAVAEVAIPKMLFADFALPKKPK
jgi:hypothetical protein